MFYLCSLVRSQYLEDGILTTEKAPESLTGCGPELPRGILDCTAAMIVEVRPAIVFYVSLALTFARRSF